MPRYVGSKRAVVIYAALVLFALMIAGSIRYQIQSLVSQGPSIDTSLSNPKPMRPSYSTALAWEAFHPVIRVFPGFQRHKSSNPTDSSNPTFLQNISSWVKHIFSPHRERSNETEQNAMDGQSTLSTADSPKSSWISYHSETINGIGVAYYNPFSPRKLRGIALLLHACGQDAADWFQLPEHRHVAAHLVRKQLALFAISSDNRVNGCWSTRFPHWQNEDVGRVTIALRQWSTDHNIAPTAPVYAIGLSSGATMLSVLSSSNLLPSMVSQALYISPGNQRAFRNASKTYPNTLFVHLMTDQHYASPSAITAARKILLKQKVELVGELPLTRVTFTPLTLHEREPRISEGLSRKIFAAARSRRGNMERIMRTSTSEDLVNSWADRGSRRAIKQVIRVVEGMHELSAVHADKVADWLVKNGRRTAVDTMRQTA